ncbi:hypothetical protein HELRODRAFT_168967 [Helobdella robusta]|uniref:Apple domain-containing protein n=1 Tax=Helobdella robusta TaxID=6412 RepID=T1F174_HELRO|nr:hypothetical protein HELRODRAFT_168967 [Helobdella robusta]ESO09032.1 hypothetical protein HELRODRAFT_168967 [Helobdella robusta]
MINKTCFIRILFYLNEIFLISFKYACAQNLALNKPTASSSVYASEGIYSGPNLMVDGDRDPEYFAGHCFMSSDGPAGPNWALLDLADYYFVDSAILFARNDKGTYPLCGQYRYPIVASAKHTLKCNANIKLSYRYVIVQQPTNGDGYLTVCEMEVYSAKNLNSKIWKRHSNYQLVGYNFGEIKPSNKLECLLKCLPGECDSFNFQVVEEICQLNNHLNGYEQSDLRNTSGWSFYEVHFA